MALIKWRPGRVFDPFDDMVDLQKQINQLFNSSLGRTAPSAQGEWIPAVDVYKQENSYIVEAELPGIDKDDVQLSIEDNVLTISGSKKSSKKEKAENYYCYERTCGEFSRSFRLPTDIDLGKVKANFNNGVLKAELPIAETAKPKQISIDIEEK
jgi:HSP20 family protein